MKNIISFLGLGVIVAVIVWSGLVGLNKSEVVECNKLMAQAREYALWYSTEDERATCAFHEIELPAFSVGNANN